MTLQETLGATTLIIEISALACFVADGVHLVRRLQSKQSGLINHAPGLGNSFVPNGLA
jgi:hypothetical protein